jgi:5-formyltetrahydrofolate cyclo-ligase
MTEEKAALRETMKQRLRGLTAEERQSLSEEICDRILQMRPWQEAESVVLFSPLPSEPILTPLKLDCDGRRIPEILIPQNPKNGLQLPDKVDLILVPGLAFSRNGRHRLGRGGGFFDRLLTERANVFKIGICFSFQVLDDVPVEAHDVVMNAIATDRQIL